MILTDENLEECNSECEIFFNIATNMVIENEQLFDVLNKNSELQNSDKIKLMSVLQTRLAKYCRQAQAILNGRKK